MAGLIALVVLDTRRKDFLEMSLHHIFTILLLTLSFSASHLRVGAVVFVLHNLADPFLQSAKLAKVGADNHHAEDMSIVNMIVHGALTAENAVYRARWSSRPCIITFHNTTCLSHARTS